MTATTTMTLRYTDIEDAPRRSMRLEPLYKCLSAQHTPYIMVREPTKRYSDEPREDDEYNVVAWSSEENVMIAEEYPGRKKDLEICAIAYAWVTCFVCDKCTGGDGVLCGNS
jgi:hypothetical protein